MKIALLILLGSSVLAVTLPATSAQAQSLYDPVWVTSKDADVVMAEMRRRLEQDRLIEPPGDSALDILRALREQKAGGPALEELTRDLFTRLLQKGRAAMRARAFERSSQLLQAAREVAEKLNDPALQRAESELSATRKRYPDPYIVN